MTRINTPSFLVLAALALSSPRLFADYPVVSHRYLADPTTLVTPDRVYVYCSDDDESPVEGGYNIPDVVCVSTADMKNWTDHGSVFRAETDTTWAKKTWAPGAIGRGGKFYLYFGNGGANIGVVVADSPTGPFKDPLGKALIDHGTPGVQPAKNMWLFDPGAFIDDDGQAYLYFGGNGDDNVRVARLKPDMISLDGEVIKMHAPNFFEAAFVHKRNGVYYFAYSTTPRAGMRFDYMTSNHPAQGFTYRGVVSDQPPLNNNNHHAAQFEFKGGWYHIYHNRVVANEAGIPAGFRRNLAIDAFDYEPDGSIRKVTYTADGVAQLGHLDPYSVVQAETFAAQHGVETEPCSEGGMNLADLQDGDWVRIRGVNFGANGAKKFHARVASEEDNSGAIEIRVGAPDGRRAGSCRVKTTGGGRRWQNLSCEVEGLAGVQDLYLRFTGEKGKTLFKLDQWKFE
jgi:arabinoxylan arabinofuranohydrolase